jgi:steroid delta-isomerase
MNAAHIRQLYDRYADMVTKGDVDGIVALYADDATLEDPIGSEVRVGLDAIREFYGGSAGAVTMKRTGPVRVAGTGVDAATPLVVLMGAEGQQQALDIISVMTFDREGKITNMRAWWSFDDIRPATADD